MHSTQVPQVNAVSSFRSELRRLSELLLIGTVVLLALAPAVQAATIDVFAGALGGANHAFGSLTPTDWRVHAGRGVDAGLDWYFAEHLSAQVSAGVEHESVSVDGERVGQFRSIPSSALIEYHGTFHSLEPYVGAGVSYLVFRGHRGTQFGHADPPDHAALMTNGGVNYLIAPRWRLSVGAEYGPARSTAEVTHANAPTEKVDYHQLYVTTALRYRF